MNYRTAIPLILMPLAPLAALLMLAPAAAANSGQDNYQFIQMLNNDGIMVLACGQFVSEACR
jgi:hypothetical protein